MVDLSKSGPRNGDSIPLPSQLLIFGRPAYTPFLIGCSIFLHIWGSCSYSLHRASQQAFAANDRDIYKIPISKATIARFVCTVMLE